MPFRANRVRNLRMILYYDFNDGDNSFRQFSKISNYLLENEVKLFIV